MCCISIFGFSCHIFFFFQAEDGIRYYKVTGVQTCALPIYIRSFFDKLQHGWLVQFVEHRIGDKRIVRLIQKWLKAGVLEQGQWSETKEGSPQGSVISPVLAN